MEIKLNEDGTVTLAISGTYTTDELRELVDALGETRAQLAPDPEQPPEGYPITVAHPGFWHSKWPAHQGGGLLLALRDHRVGWFGIVLHPAGAQQLVGHVGRYLAHATGNAEGASGTGTQNHDLTGFSGGNSVH